MAQPAQARRSVLVVGDDAFMLERVRRALGPTGFLVESASTVPGALAVLQQPPEPALVILDLELRGGGALGFLTQVKVQRSTLPVIVLTPSAGGAAESQARAVGANAFLAKPVSLPHLRQLVEALARGGRP